MIGKVFIDLPDMEPSPFPLYIVFRGGGETRSINYILNDKTFDEDAKKHFADFFKLWYNSDLKEKLNSSGLDMTPEFLQFFWGGEFNNPVVMSLGSITVDRLIKWEAAVNFNFSFKSEMYHNLKKSAKCFFAPLSKVLSFKM